LQETAKKRGWSFQVEYSEEPECYRKVGRLFVQDMDETIIECVQRRDLMDAFATLYSNRYKVRLEDLSKQSYWKRIKGTEVRVRQALEYGCSLIKELTGKDFFKVKKSKLKDEYVRREVGEAIKRVVEFQGSI